MATEIELKFSTKVKMQRAGSGRNWFWNGNPINLSRMAIIYTDQVRVRVARARNFRMATYQIDEENKLGGIFVLGLRLIG